MFSPLNHVRETNVVFSWRQFKFFFFHLPTTHFHVCFFIVYTCTGWNPAVEMQAICRSHRLGQKKAVTATRFITKDSIEARMLELQKKKEFSV